jgi:quercetin dioxygenase-like cupin family protein
MRLFITGVDADGKSCLVSNDEVEINSAAPGFGIAIPYNTTQSPPPARPQGNADLIDQFLEPGHARWMVIDLGPDSDTPVHHTDTLDLLTVLSGSVGLILDDGTHRVEAGDMVVMTGVDHGWKAGLDGCRMSAVLIGTPAPA